MKYHYQFVSNHSVRIELIPEDRKELHFLETSASLQIQQDEILTAYYRKGLQAYSRDANLTLTRFMNFPKVALCTYETQHMTIEKVVNII